MGTDITDSKNTLYCSFCGKSQHEVRKLIAGPTVYICNECIELCSDIVREDHKNMILSGEGLPKPQEICKTLDEYVIGQDQAKKILSVAVYNHYKRLANLDESNSVEIQKSNILVIGPTGCGKTLLAQTLARILDVPFAVADATTLTEAGYVGEDVENIILRLLQAADYNIERTQKGIVFIDEVDKQEFLQIDTTNILFICSGAFAGLEKIISSRDNQSGIGFGAEVKNKEVLNVGQLFKKVEPEDLLKYGLIPEFIGRLPVVATIDELGEEALIKILTEPKNAIVKQFKKLFEMEGVKLSFTEDALHEIAKKAIKRKAGARGLRTIMEECLLELMYDIPGNKDVVEVVIDGQVVVDKVKPKLVLKKKSKGKDQVEPTSEEVKAGNQ